MRGAAKRSLYWSPRILCILFALFLGLFASDAFGEGRPPGEAILAFLVHLLPSAAILAALAIGWRWEWAGGVLLLGFAAAYPVLAGGRVGWTALLMISGPPLLAGVLFLVSWAKRADLRAG